MPRDLRFPRSSISVNESPGLRSLDIGIGQARGLSIPTRAREIQDGVIGKYIKGQKKWSSLTSRRLGLIVRRESVAPGDIARRFALRPALDGDWFKGNSSKRIACWDVRCFSAKCGRHDLDRRREICRRSCRVSST